MRKDMFMSEKYLLKPIMLVHGEHTTLGTYAWSEEYLHVHMNNYYAALDMLLSKQQAELLRDTLDVFLEGGYVHE